jgi:hypothetical protein
MLVCWPLASATGTVDIDRLARRLGRLCRLSACNKASRQVSELRRIEDVDELVKRKEHSRDCVVGRGHIFVLAELLVQRVTLQPYSGEWFDIDHGALTRRIIAKKSWD